MWVPFSYSSSSFMFSSSFVYVSVHTTPYIPPGVNKSWNATHCYLITKQVALWSFWVGRWEPKDEKKLRVYMREGEEASGNVSSSSQYEGASVTRSVPSVKTSSVLCWCVAVLVPDRVRFREGVCATCVQRLWGWGRPKVGSGSEPAEAHLLAFPLMCWYLGRQGSSGKGSWENTESSPEEQELRVSGKLGEYCSVGAHRSRYSWGRR